MDMSSPKQIPATPPFFMAVQPQKWTANRWYRVYVSPEELVCVWAGKGNEVSAWMGGQFGLLGGLLAAAMSPAQKNKARGKELDSKPLDEARDDHEYNFSLAIGTIIQAEIAAPTIGFRMSYGGLPVFALLRVIARGEELLLALPTPDDAEKARRFLLPVLGPVLNTDAAPDEVSQRTRRTRLFGALGAVLGAGIMLFQLLRPGLGAGAFAAGQIAGLILGVLLFAVGLHAIVTGGGRIDSGPINGERRSGLIALAWVIGILGVVFLPGLVLWRADLLGPARGPGPPPAQEGPAEVNPKVAKVDPPIAKADPPVGKVVPKVSEPGPLIWQAYTYPEVGFTVAFPGVPKHLTKQAGDTKRTRHLYMVELPDARFSVLTFDPPLPDRPMHLFQSLRALRLDFPLGHISSEQPVTLGAYRGHAFTIRFVDRQILRQTFRGHGRDFTLEISTGTHRETPPSALKFFESFRPTDADQPETEPAGRSSPWKPSSVLTAPREVVSLAFAADGQTLQAFCQNGETAFFDMQTAKQLKTQGTPGSQTRLVAAAQSTDLSTGLASDLNGRCNLLDLAKYRLKIPFISKLEDLAWSVALSNDGELAATGHGDSARIWRVADGKQLTTLETGAQVNALLFLPDGKMLATATRNNTVTLWSAPAGAQLSVLQGGPGGVPSAGAVWALACSPDGKLLAAGGNDETVRLWDLETRSQRLLLKHEQTVRSVVVIDNGKTVVTGDDAGTVTLWDAVTGKQTAMLPAPANQHSARTLAYSAKTGMLASGLGNEVHVWNVAELK